MQTCNYCSEIMMGEYETLPNNSYFFFLCHKKNTSYKVYTP